MMPRIRDLDSRISVEGRFQSRTKKGRWARRRAERHGAGARAPLLGLGLLRDRNLHRVYEGIIDVEFHPIITANPAVVGS